MEHICLFINHNRWKKTGCTIDYFKILYGLLETMERNIPQQGEKEEVQFKNFKQNTPHIVI